MCSACGVLVSNKEAVSRAIRIMCKPVLRVPYFVGRVHGMVGAQRARDQGLGGRNIAPCQWPHHVRRPWGMVVPEKVQHHGPGEQTCPGVPAVAPYGPLVGESRPKNSTGQRASGGEIFSCVAVRTLETPVRDGVPEKGRGLRTRRKKRPHLPLIPSCGVPWADCYPSKDDKSRAGRGVMS